jgi:predicted Fe-S protein YdhL (DUF1289 family)
MTALADSAAIESPCVRICSLDRASDVCTGCGRTLAEIARWYAMTGEERSHILAGLPQRMKSLGARSDTAKDV